MEPPQGGHSQLAFFSNDTYWRAARVSIFPKSCTGKCRLRYPHFCRDVSGNRHRRYPASSAPHRTAKPDDVAFSLGRVERELVREAPCFLGRDDVNFVETGIAQVYRFRLEKVDFQRRYLRARR